ncbi:MAG: glycosyltransferase [Clostridia bacterium]
MKKIVCLSTTSFDPLPTRKQNIMTRLPDCEVLYFDPPVSFIAPLKDKTAFKKVFRFLKKPYNPKKNITVYSMPPVIPFFNKIRFVNKVNQFFASVYVNSKITKHNFHDVLLWCYSPSSCDIVDRIQHKHLVYDCVDRHSGYVGMINPQIVDNMEKDLAKKSSIVFSTAIGLHETLIKHNQNAYMIPNGCAYELFSKANSKDFAIPQELKDVRGKVFGFVGMLQECIAYDYIEELAKSRPQDTIIFIGRTLPGVSIEHLKKYDNIIFRGLVPQAELPAYISRFDVCLNTFTSGMLSKDVSPLKFYEYLATGKPIVSTKEPLQVADFADCIYIAESKEEFLVQCQNALDEHGEEKIKTRMNCGKMCSWTERVKQMHKILDGQYMY